jgi:RNA polymerase sigma-70 factor (ECF subfamily)
MSEGYAGLIEDCIKGNETAITQLVQEHQLDIFRLALSILNDPNEANEATQETFISAFRAMDSYREASKLKAWLYTIAINTSRSRLRKRKALEKLHHTLITIFRAQVQNVPTPEEMVIGKEEDAALWKALEKLGEKHRISIVLRYYHDLTIAEIAELLNINEGTVHSRLSIGRERLRSELAEQIKSKGE